MALSNPLIQNIPIANPQTKEVLQEKLIIATDTPYSLQYTKQPYTELVLYSFSPTNEGTFTETVTEDFALTQIHCHLEGGSSTTKNHTISLNSIPIVMMEAQPLSSSDIDFTFPSVIIRKGSVIVLEATESGGAQNLRCLHSFFGYHF